MVQDFGFSQNLVQGWVKTWSKIVLLVFPSFIVFLGILKKTKTQIVCRGAKIIFWQFFRVSEKGFRKRMCAFCFCLFMLDKEKEENMKQVEKDIQKNAQKIVFLEWL